MVWGGNDDAVDRWVKQLTENDPKLVSLHILSFRRMSTKDLARIFTAIADNTVLENLYVSGHALDATSLEALSESLTLNETLKSLNIGNATFGQHVDLVKIFCEGLAVNDGLITLDLENKALDKESVKVLSNALVKNQHLKEINLARNGLDDESMSALAPALTKLTKVNLGMNEVGVQGCQILADQVLNNKTSQVQELDLSDNPLLGGAAVVAAALKDNQQLRVLKMASVATVNDAALPPSALSEQDSNQQQPQQQEDLTHGNTLIDALGQALAINRHLSEVWLDNNQIESRALENLVRYLDNSAVQELKLRQNLIDDEGAQMLSTTTRLTHLELGQNQITAKGFGLLLDHGSLEYLGLFNNSVGGFANDVLPGLEASRVQRLDIGCNGIVHADLKAMTSILMEGGVPELRLLEMGGNVEDKEMELWEETMETISRARRELEIVWKRKPSQMESQQAPPTNRMMA
ncbi:MAG: hypothetical protein EXX96DRAFT_324484 [Benjaminiella poitrasii]|nr:MAG: hypothetical protein EXX96DRAFT_324484 [Benjaminiella poitrasii]